MRKKKELHVNFKVLCAMQRFIVSETFDIAFASKQASQQGNGISLKNILLLLEIKDRFHNDFEEQIDEIIRFK